MVASTHVIAIPSVLESVGATAENLTWTSLFELAESIVGHARHPAVLSFDQGEIQLRNQFDDMRSGVRRLQLSEAARSDTLSRLARTLGFRSQRRLCAQTFIPSFLTFLDTGHRIGIFCEDRQNGDGLRADLSRHAPWHEFVIMDPSAQTGQQIDVAIICAARSDRLIASFSTQLTILAGNNPFHLGGVH